MKKDWGKVRSKGKSVALGQLHTDRLGRQRASREHDRKVQSIAVLKGLTEYVMKYQSKSDKKKT